MARFVSDERVAVFLESDPEHIIYIRPKMNVGVQNRVISTIASIKAETATKSGASTEQIVRLDMGAYNLALLTCNIVGWAGPDFDSRECTPENIEQLDPDDPLLDKVLGEIQRRNVSPTSNGASPNLPKSKGTGRNTLTQ